MNTSIQQTDLATKKHSSDCFRFRYVQKFLYSSNEKVSLKIRAGLSPALDFLTCKSRDWSKWTLVGEVIVPRQILSLMTLRVPVVYSSDTCACPKPFIAQSVIEMIPLDSEEVADRGSSVEGVKVPF